MAGDKIYVGAVGVRLALDAVVDVSEATELKIRVIKPKGEVVEWVPSVAQGGLSVVEYFTKEGDFDRAGLWKFQVYAYWSDTDYHFGETVEQRIYNLGH